MKDSKQRKEGSYTETFTKEINNVVYTKTETTVIGKNFVIKTSTNSYNPPIMFGFETDGWVKKLSII